MEKLNESEIEKKMITGDGIEIAIAKALESNIIEHVR